MIKSSKDNKRRKNAKLFQAFARDDEGNMLVTTAIGIVSILGLIGFSLDYAALSTPFLAANQLQMPPRLTLLFM